ncbi:MAG TPA: helix-turn-helix domain-containing protein [Chitinophagaceae bacterium]
MDEIIKFDTISQYNAFNNNDTLHPLVSVIDMSKANPRFNSRQYFGFYTVFLKEIKCGNLRYGCNYYDYEEGTLVFVGPGQVIGGPDDKGYHQPKGFVLAFHADILKGTQLGRHMSDYNFFSYDLHEALHLSDSERKIVTDCFDKIKFELEHNIDKHSKTLVATNIELFLNYCIRFYDRQFITRENVHKGTLQRFEDLLNIYFLSDKPQAIGLPSVSYCAEQLNLSPNYFGDLVKKETGKTAQEYIQLKLMDIAKEKIFDNKKSISEIAYELGFKYPAHFTRLFKQHIGYSPREYRALNLN